MSLKKKKPRRRIMFVIFATGALSSVILLLRLPLTDLANTADDEKMMTFVEQNLQGFLGPIGASQQQSSYTSSKTQELVVATVHENRRHNHARTQSTFQSEKTSNGGVTTTIDVLSIGSNTRPDYWTTQRDTWAIHSLVRNFFVATEETGDDYDPNCRSMSVSMIRRWKAKCLKLHGAEKQRNKTKVKFLMNRFSHTLGSEVWIRKKKEPINWMCAQTRFPLALSKTILSYQQRKEALPDYLLMVDDDTYYNVDTYHDMELRRRDPSVPYVSAGCRAFNGRQRALSTFAIGGFGLTISRGSLERFVRPILDPSTTIRNVVDPWETFVLGRLEEDFLLERSLFHYNMSLIELMDSYTRYEKFSKMKKWKRGFCFHGDWVPSIFVMVYRIGGQNVLNTINGSESTEFKKTGLCLNENSSCNATSLACHYQSPEAMKRLSSELTAG